MKELFKKYKTVIRFVVLFLGTYLMLSFFYAIYLKFFSGEKYFPDFITNLVAKQSASLLQDFGIGCFLTPDNLEQSMLLTIENKYSVGIVEGCNSVSVIILFFSFIIAFAENFKKTFLFLFAGAVLIYIVNIIRIAILVVALYKYPKYEDMLHSVVFPGIIYSLVFVLWMLWVRMLKPKSAV